MFVSKSLSRKCKTWQTLNEKSKFSLLDLTQTPRSLAYLFKLNANITQITAIRTDKPAKLIEGNYPQKRN